MFTQSESVVEKFPQIISGNAKTPSFVGGLWKYLQHGKKIYSS
jgi:hypothetical protein